MKNGVRDLLALSFLLVLSAGLAAAGSGSSGGGGGGTTQICWSSGTYDNTVEGTEACDITDTGTVLNCTTGYSCNNTCTACDQPPSISITSPADGTVFTAPASITITTNASDPDGSVSKVDFYENKVHIGISNTSPYTFTWNNVGAGTYSLTATATDNGGLSATSSPITVTVNNPPTLTISAGPSITENVNTATALQGSVTSGVTPYTYTWSYGPSNCAFIPTGNETLNPDGSLSGKLSSNGAINSLISCSNAGSTNTVTLSVKDSASQSATSTTTVYVNIPPTITISTPTNNSNYGNPATVSISATGSDTDDKLSHIDLYYSTDSGTTWTSVHSCTSLNIGSYTCTGSFTTSSAGSYTIAANVYDNQNAGAQATVTINSYSCYNTSGQTCNPVSSCSSAGLVNGPGSCGSGYICCAPATQLNVSAGGPYTGTAGTGIALSGTVTGGTGGYTYSWSQPQGQPCSFSSTTAQNPTLNCTGTVSNGSVTLTGSDSYGHSQPSSATLNVNYQQLTAVTNGPYTGTAGTQTMLTSGATGGTETGYQYKWTSTDTSCSFANSGNFTTLANDYVTCTSAGTKTLTLTVEDSRNTVTASSSTTLTLNNPPSVSITSPASNSTVTTGTSVSITASASDTDGSVIQVQFFVNGILSATDTTSPYTTTWTPTTSGTYYITAVATDNQGATASASVTVNANAPPTVSVTSPASGASYNTPTNLLLQATASDTDDAISKVEFFDNGASIGVSTSTSSPYTLQWNNIAPGLHSLTAKATDGRGATTTSTAVPFTVTDQAPTVSITSPANNSVFAAPASVTVTASASDPDGISKVEFYNGTTLIATDTASPYTATVTSTGAYSVTAKAYDTWNVSTTSAAIAFTIDQPPAVSITSPPASDATYTAPATITFSASASDPDGTIDTVNFYNNGTYIGQGTLSGSTYNFTWQNVAAGSYSITAKAWDKAGLSTTTPPLTVTVNPAPACSLSPSSASVVSGSNATFTASGTNFQSTFTITQGSAACNGAASASVSCSSGTCTITCTNYTASGQVTATASNGTVCTPASVTVTAQNLCSNSGVCTPASTGCQAGYFNNTQDTCNVNGGTICCVPNLTANAGPNASTNTNTLTQLFGSYSGGIQPYTFSWSAPAVYNCSFISGSTLNPWVSCSTGGNKAITLTVTDARGSSYSASSSMTLSVNAPPSVSITSPASGTTVQAPANVNITVSASDPDGSISEVDLYDNGTFLTKLVGSQNYTWNNVPVGSHSLTATAIDNGGASTASSAVSLTVTAPNQPPTVSISSPTDGSSYPTMTRVTLTATGSDSDGTISLMQFFVNGTLLSSSQSNPYTTTWTTPTTPGTYTITAMAIDNQGATGTASVNVSVTNRSPTVSITSPAGGTVFTAPASITITTNASDPDGSVSKVDFYANNTKIGTSTTAPYTLAWSNVPAGVYSLTATATDNLGATGSSYAVQVSVNQLPTASITSPASGTTYVAPANIAISASASDTDNDTISEMDFYNNGTYIGTATIPANQSSVTGTFTWQNIAPGSYSLTAKAKDSLGGWTTSSPVSVTVNPAPTCSISPATKTITSGENGTFTVSTTNFSSPISLNNGNVACNGAAKAAVSCGNGTCTITCTNYTQSGQVTASTTDNGVNVTCMPASVTVVAQNACSSGVCTPVSSGCSTGTFNNTSDTCNVNGGTICCVPNLQVTGLTASTTTPNANTATQLTATYTGGTSPYSAQWSSSPQDCVFLGTNPIANAASPQSILVSCSPGTKTITFTVTDSGNRNATNQLALNVNSPPSISITSPSDGSTVTVSNPTTISANATDPDGTVTQVQFKVDGSTVGTDTAGPYTAQWTPNSPGTHTITATATDNQGATTTATATVNANAPPSVTMTAPQNNASINYNSTVQLAAAATDPDDTIQTLYFTVNSGTPMAGTASGSNTYTANWTPPGSGTYSIKATATDTRNASTTSAQITVTVNNPTNQPYISTPSATGGTLYSAPAMISLSVTATPTAPGASITKIEFYANNASIGTGTPSNGTYNLGWSNVNTGTYAATAKATDSYGNTATSQALQLAVQGPQAASQNDVVSASISADKTEYTIGTDTQITLTITAKSNTSITSVPFSVNQTGPNLATTTIHNGTINLGGQNGTATYNVQLTLKPGTYTFTAIIPAQTGENDLANNTASTIVNVYQQKSAAVPELPDALALAVAIAVLGILATKPKK